MSWTVNQALLVIQTFVLGWSDCQSWLSIEYQFNWQLYFAFTLISKNQLFAVYSPLASIAAMAFLMKLNPTSSSSAGGWKRRKILNICFTIYCFLGVIYAPGTKKKEARYDSALIHILCTNINITTWIQIKKSKEQNDISWFQRIWVKSVKVQIAIGFEFRFNERNEHKHPST